MNKRSNNLCDIYILPLVGLNPSNFGIGNFINSYVNENDDQHVIVKIERMNSLIKSNLCYRFDFNQGDHSLVVFEVPAHFREVIKLFKDGKYSLFSEEAKNTIRKKSGLMYRSPSTDGKSRSARELLVLEKSKELREAMQKELDEKIDPNAELASIPGPDNYYDLNLSNKLVC